MLKFLFRRNFADMYYNELTRLKLNLRMQLSKLRVKHQTAAGNQTPMLVCSALFIVIFANMEMDESNQLLIFVGYIVAIVAVFFLLRFFFELLAIAILEKRLAVIYREINRQEAIMRNVKVVFTPNTRLKLCSVYSFTENYAIKSDYLHI